MFDFKRFEIDHLKKKNDLVILELIEIFYKHFKKAYKIEKKKIPHLKEISSLTSLFNFIEKIDKTSQNVQIMNFVKNDTFGGILINYYLKKKKFRVLNFYNPGVSSFNNSYTKINTNLFNKIFLLFSKKKETYQKIKQKFLNILAMMLKINSKYYFVAGEKCFLEFKNKNHNNKYSFIKGSSWDYSKKFIFKKKIKYQKKYCVYLDAPGPRFSSDSSLYGEKHQETVDFTYPSLRKFFNYFEKIHNLEVIIAPHPKTYIKNKDPIFGKRKVISGKTQELIRDSSFVLTRNSTAIVFAIFYNKPILLFYTNQTYNTEAYWNSKNISKNTSCKLVNINNFSKKILQAAKKINKQKYKKYIYNFCSFKDVKKANYEIIQKFYNSN